MVADRLKPFGTSIFSEMTKLAIQHRAVNLSQGFPDFDGPRELFDAAHRAMYAGNNQYARSLGLPALVRVIAEERKLDYGLEYDPMEEVIVFSGATEGLMSSMLGLLNPGDELVCFEPVYDSYPVGATLAGARARYCPLRFPDFHLDGAELESLITPRTRLILLNSPHNPTGKVFSKEDLELIARIAIERDLIVLTDEVYEHIWYGDHRHVPIATLPGMRERTLSISSAAKTYSITGWKVGWATGPRHLVQAAQAAHQFVTFATSTPFQAALAEIIPSLRGPYYGELRASYTRARDFLLQGLDRAGFKTSVPRGAYFIMADFSDLSDGSDMEFARASWRPWASAPFLPRASIRSIQSSRRSSFASRSARRCRPSRPP